MTVQRVNALRAGGSLLFVTDHDPGLTRKRKGSGFAYYDTDGNRITDPKTLTRIRRLAIPPAWTSVWISPDPFGHIQAIGWDARGRKQYRYHSQWREERDRDKFDRLRDFGAALPAIRTAVDDALSARTVSRERVIAAVVALIDCTLMRVGNQRYVDENNSFGLTTLRNRHVKVDRRCITICYRGKSGVRQRAVVSDRRLVSLVRHCQELPGQTLFQWSDTAGRVHPIGSGDVNHFLHEITGESFTAKDFRTWGASASVAGSLALEPAPETVRARRALINAAIDEAAQLLGNTRTVCRASYVHPAVIEAYQEGRLQKCAAELAAERPRLAANECLLLDVLD